jgi:hypothetical protein
MLENPNLYNFVGNAPLDAFDTWGNTWWKPSTWEWPKAVWEALKYIVPVGPELGGAVECGPGLYSIYGNRQGVNNFNPFDPNSPIPEPKPAPKD